MSYIYTYFEKDISSIEWSSKDLIKLRNWYNDPLNNSSPFDDDGTFTYTKFRLPTGKITITPSEWYLSDYNSLKNWFDFPDVYSSPFNM